MAKELILQYDHEGDILEASSDDSTATIAQDIGDDVWLKVDVNTGTPRGFIILNLAKRKEGVKLPLILQKATWPIHSKLASKPGEEYLLVNNPN